jgi:Spy/CpxP family protein refolding chaperone
MIQEDRARTRMIGAALLALAFVAGAAAGVTADRWMTPRATIRTRIADMSGVLDKLSLTPQQRAQAESIIQRSGPRTEETMLEVADRLRRVADSVDAELRAILTAEQRAKLDSLRRRPTFMLKRISPGGTTIDTVFPRRRDSARLP